MPSLSSPDSVGEEEVPVTPLGAELTWHPASARFGAAAGGEAGAGVVCSESDGKEREEAEEAGERAIGECGGGASPHFWCF